MPDQDRLERFETMLADIEEEAARTDEQLNALRSQNKMKTATFKQLMARKLTLSSFLSAYEAHGLK